MQRRAHAVDQLADHGICAHLHAHIDGEIDLIGITEGSAQARELLFAEVDVVIRDRHAAPVQRQDGRPGLRDLQAVTEGSELILQISRLSRVSGGLLREQIKVLQRAELAQHFAEGGIGIGLGNAVRRDAVDLVRDAGQRELQLLRITVERNRQRSFPPRHGQLSRAAEAARRIVALRIELGRERFAVGFKRERGRQRALLTQRAPQRLGKGHQLLSRAPQPFSAMRAARGPRAHSTRGSNTALRRPAPAQRPGAGSRARSAFCAFSAAPAAGPLRA